MKETAEQKKARIAKIFTRLHKAYPDPKCALDHSNALELLMATILSAQCTDKRVNLVTPALFKRYKTAHDYAHAKPSELEGIIRTTGFYKNKAKNIMGAAKGIVERFGGRVPKTMEELVTLPGVGRKTANVILGNVYDTPGICVDTHMIRLNNLLGMTKNEDPVKIEFDLMKLLPPKNWVDYSHLIIHHGRVRCAARRPDCAGCEIRQFCPSARSIPSPPKKPRLWQ